MLLKNGMTSGQSAKLSRIKRVKKALEKSDRTQRFTCRSVSERTKLSSRSVGCILKGLQDELGLDPLGHGVWEWKSTTANATPMKEPESAVS